MSVSLVPEGGHQDAITVTVPGGLLKDLEKDLPALVESLLKSIEGKDGSAGV
jgi:nanoRNase/pAp phosphatase (c-di-AMP/oligoRNAs hydrolase)